MKLSEITNSETEMLRTRYAALFKDLKNINSGVEGAIDSIYGWDGKGDAEDIINEMKEYLEDIQETLSDIIKKHSKSL